MRLRLVGVSTELETLLNTQYLFLEENKDKDFSKFLPTILFNMVKEGLLTEEFLLQWGKEQIEDIDKNYLFNANRDAQFREKVQPYLESIDPDEDDEEDEEA